jgi:hypothetical protein
MFETIFAFAEKVENTWDAFVGKIEKKKETKPQKATEEDIYY